MAQDGDHSEPLKVGVLFSHTGPTAFVERTQLNATLLAIEEINAAGGAGGREVVPVAYDAASSPPLFAQLGERLLVEDRVGLIFGCYMTNTRQALLPIVERRNAMLAYPAPYEGFEYSPNILYGGAVPNQHIVMLARHLMAHHGKRFYCVGTRYTFPFECNRVMMTLVAEQAGQVVAERYVPLDAPRRDLVAIVADIKAKRPEVVFCTVVGEAARRFFEACREAAVEEHTVVASLTITEAEVALMGAEVAAGQLTAATYFQSIDSAANRRFVASYKARFGVHEQTNAMAETAYGLTHMVLAAVGRCGSVEPDVLRGAVAAAAFEAPQGAVRLDPDNNHFYLWPRIGRVRADGEFEILERAAAVVKPDPYLINHTLDDCAPTLGSRRLTL